LEALQHGALDAEEGRAAAVAEEEEGEEAAERAREAVADRLAACTATLEVLGPSLAKAQAAEASRLWNRPGLLPSGDE